MTTATKRAKRAARKTSPAVPRKAKTVAHRLTPDAGPVRGVSGLEWLHRKKRITVDQRAAGERYGREARLAEVEHMVSLKSCLADQRGSGGGLALPPPAPVSIDARRAHDAARAVLAHSEIVDVCAAVCVHSLTPSAYVGSGPHRQRRLDQLEAALVIGLNALISHYGPRR